MQKQITRKQFRQLIILQFLFLVLALITPFAISSFASETTKAIFDIIADAPFRTYDVIIALIVLPLGLWSLQNMFALYQFKSYAPKHLLYIIILGILSGFASYPVEVLPIFGLEDMFYYLINLCSGATLALVYFSNIADEFKPLVSQLIVVKDEMTA